MATYLELHGLRNDPTVGRKVHVAMVEVAYDILNLVPADTAPRIAWAQDAIANPQGAASTFIAYVLIDNKAATVAQILGASDAAFKSNVIDAVAVMVGPAA